MSFWAFGVFILPLEREFGWARAEVSGAFSASWLVAGLIGPFVGRAVDRYGARPLMLAGTAASGVSFLALAGVQELWQFYLGQIVMSFCRAWMFYIPMNALVTRWFVRRRSVALALATSGFAVGGMLFVPLLTFLEEAAGWRWGYVFCGGVLYAVVFPLVLWVLRSRPEDLGLLPDGDPPRTVPSAADPAFAQPAYPQPTGHQWSSREALRSRTFWLVALGFSLTFFSNISFTVHAIPFFVSRGLTADIGAGVISATNAVVALVRVPFGLLIDRAPSVRAIMFLAIASQAAAMSVLLVSTEPAALWSFVGFWSVGGGGMPLLEAAFIVRTFGERHYGALLGTMGMVETTGTLIGPVLAGFVFDVTGSYEAAMLMFLGTSAGAFACFAALRPPAAASGERTRR